MFTYIFLRGKPKKRDGLNIQSVPTMDISLIALSWCEIEMGWRFSVGTVGPHKIEGPD